MVQVRPVLAGSPFQFDLVDRTNFPESCSLGCTGMDLDTGTRDEVSCGCHVGVTPQV